MNLKRFLSWTAVGMLAVAVAAPSFAAGSGHTSQVTGNVAPWVRQAAYVGPADASQTIQFDVTLTLRNQASLDSYVQSAQTRGGGRANHLTADQFISQYSPSASDYQAVQDWLTGAGLQVVGTADNRFYVRAQGTIGQVEQALGVQINLYNYNGSTFMSNAGNPSVPGNLASVVDSVIGLDTAARAHPNAETMADAPQMSDAIPCGSKGVTDNCYYVPSKVRHAYGLDKTGYNGAGATIAIVDAYGNATAKADLDAFDSLFGLPAADLTVAGNNGTPYLPYLNPNSQNQQGWAGEIALDLQYAHAMAPGAKLVLMASGNAYNDLDEAVNSVVVHQMGDVISLSWGMGEIFVSDATAREFNRIAQEAIAQGISIQVSSGDYGDNTILYGAKSADFPSSSPFVTSVGGTSLFLNSSNEFGFESAWGTTEKKRPKGSDTWIDYGFIAGGGGGKSGIFAQPAWQTGVPAGLSSGKRTTPDISMVADPYTGVPVNIGGYYYVYGGTSLAAPLFSGLVAQALQAHGGRLGQIAPQLYPLAGTPAVRDVVPSDASSYSVTFVGTSTGNTYEMGFDQDSSLVETNGYDNATGLGSPWAPAMIPALSN